MTEEDTGNTAIVLIRHRFRQEKQAPSRDWKELELNQPIYLAGADVRKEDTGLTDSPYFRIVLKLQPTAAYNRLQATLKWFTTTLLVTSTK